MLRPCNPADIVGLLILQARAEPNSAYGKHALASSGDQRFPSLSGLVGEWLPNKQGRHTWVLSQHGLPVGIVSVHRRKGAGSWEVDRLQVARGKEPISIDLLDRMSLLLGTMAADRLFLRVAQDSPAEWTAREAGFAPLVREALYVRPGGLPVGTGGNGAPPLRPAGAPDILRLFRLYTMGVPAPIRQAEGIGLRDWEASIDGNSGLPREHIWVMDQGDELLGAAIISKNGGRRRLLDFLARPMDSTTGMALVRGAIEQGGDRSSLLCLLPEYQWNLTRHLEDHGFKKLGMFHVYMKPVLARERRTGLLPVGV